MNKADFVNIPVYIHEEVHPIYEDLVSRSKQADEDRPFMTMKDVFIVAACLGASSNQYSELSSGKDIFRGQVFDEKIDIPALAALAFYKTRNLETLSDPKEIVRIVQGWANSGIHVLSQEVLFKSGRPLQNLVDLIIENT